MNLDTLITSIPLKSGLFGKKPTALTIYSDGIILSYKTGSKEYLFSQISAIKSLDYMAPNPINYHVDLFDNAGAKITSLDIPYEQRANLPHLFMAHRDYTLGPNFPMDLPQRDFVLDNYLSWQKGKLVHKTRKGTTTYLPEQIDRFTETNGSWFFTLHGSKDTVGLFFMDCPNCLTSLAVCHAIAADDPEQVQIL